MSTELLVFDANERRALVRPRRVLNSRREAGPLPCFARRNCFAQDGAVLGLLFRQTNQPVVCRAPAADG